MIECNRNYYNVDIVACIDATASMGPIIEDIKANLFSYLRKYVDAMEESGKEIGQLRIKVIAFRDYGYDSEPMVESRFYTLPDDENELASFVNGIEPKGGGDIPENALEALAIALKSDWTTGGSRRRHVILMFSDAPALPLGERASFPSYPSDMPADIAELTAWWEGTDQSFTGTYQPKAGRLVAFVPNTESWTQFAAWNGFWPAYSQAGMGLSCVDLERLIDLLAFAF